MEVEVEDLLILGVRRSIFSGVKFGGREDYVLLQVRFFRG